MASAIASLRDAPGRVYAISAAQLPSFGSARLRVSESKSLLISRHVTRTAPRTGRLCRLVVSNNAAEGVPGMPAVVPPAPTPDQQKLASDARSARSLCWVSFWGQLALSCVSGVILVFSVTVREGMVPPPSTWLALVGVVTALISTFLAWTYRRTATALSQLAPGVTPRDFIKRLEAGAQLNLAGMGATILALQAEVGSLLTKTLSSSAANPYSAKAADAPVAFDVFTVQASTNTVMCHFVSILFINWVLRIINRRIRLSAQ